MSVIASLAAELSLDASQFFRGMKDSEEAIRQFSGTTATHASAARSSLESIGAESNRAASALKGNLMGAMRGVAEATGLALGAFTAWKTIEVASRAQEMDVALQRLGKNAGLTTQAVKEQTEAIKEMGITTNVAQYTLSQFLKQNLDSSKAAQLARVAQDAAVYSMQDSSTTLQSLIYGIQTYQTEIFRTAGLNVNVGKSFEDYAKSIGKSTSDLSEGERMTAVLNAVLEEGTTIAGTYEAAMGTASKQVRSFPRYIEEIQESIGSAFIPAFTDAVFGLAEFTKAIQKLVSDGGALQPTIATIGKIAAIPFAAMGKAVKGLADNMDKFRIPLQIVVGLLVTKAAVGLATSIANWVKYRIELAQTMLVQKQMLSQYGLEIEEAVLAARAEDLHAAAMGRLAASIGITVTALEELIAAKAANNALPNGAPVMTGTPSLGASIGGMAASMGPQLAITAALTAGFMTYQGVQQENQKTKDISNNRVERVIEREDTVAARMKALRAEQRKAAATAYSQTKSRNKGVLAAVWGAAADWGLTAGWGDDPNDRQDIVTQGAQSRSDIAAIKKKRAEYRAVVKDINVRVEELGNKSGKSAEQIKGLAKAMGIDLYNPSVQEEKALRDNLLVTDDLTVASGRLAKALGELGNKDKTVEERSQALTAAMKQQVENTYSVASSTRSAMDALTSQDKAFKDASKSGGDTLKEYRQHWAEHNQSIANTFVDASEKMREQGTSVAEYLQWGSQYRDIALQQAAAQGQTNEQVAEFKRLMTDLMGMNLTRMGGGKKVLESLQNLSADVKFSSAAVVNNLLDSMKGQDQKTVILALKPHIDWSAIDMADRAGMIRKMFERGAVPPVELTFGVATPGTDLAKWLKQINDAKLGAKSPIVQKILAAFGYTLQPGMIATIKALRDAGLTHAGDAFRAFGGTGKLPASQQLVPGLPNEVFNVVSQFTNEALDQMGPAAGTGGATSNDRSVNGGGGGGGGKTAEELAREARRMKTAMETISRLALPPAAQAAFDAFPELADRESIAKSLESWRENYAKTLAGIVQSTDKSTAQIVASWGLPQEQLQSVAQWVNSLGSSMRQFSNINSVNALASGRAGNRLEEWVDGLIELKNRGLNPMLLRQLLEAGPESLGAVRRLLRGGDLLGKANEQYNRITSEINTLISDPMLGAGLGADLATGVGKGIADATPQVVTASTAFLWTVIAEMKKAMGIASPSKVTAQMIGEPMIAGISNAIRSGSTGVGQALQDAVGSVDPSTGLPSVDSGSGPTVIENHFHVAGFVVDKTSVDAMIEAQDWAMRTSGGR